ncbi:MAG: phosphoribosylanthranilate isomerase [Eubacteriales bacterium]|nr:phosphoribosylanthranilate isomerase [Eubacteriales bacterium]
MRTKIKFCGLTRPGDVEAANELEPDYIGFVFAKTSRRYVNPETAAILKRHLKPSIKAAGVFVREEPERIAALFDAGIIDAAQLHGGEGTELVLRLKAMTSCPLIQAFRIEGREDILAAGESQADLVLLDAGEGGTGTTFDWSLLRGMKRPYILAGGLNENNVAKAVRALSPYGVDVSSGIETNGRKDREKMRRFAAAVRYGMNPENRSNG